MNNLFTLHFSLYYPIYKQFIGEGCSLHPSFHGKRLRDSIVRVSAMASCIFSMLPLSLPSKNIMYSLPIFPQIVEDYKQYLRKCVPPALSFLQFIKPYHVRYASLTQWMRRHGLSVQQLQYDALLEKCGTDRSEVIAQLASKMQPDPEIPPITLKGKCGISEDKLLRKISITFPDGLVVNIVESSSAALYDFINRYNHLLDSQDVRIG